VRKNLYPDRSSNFARRIAEAIENLPSLFTSGMSEEEEMRKQYEAEKVELNKRFCELTNEVNLVKKVCRTPRVPK